MNARTTALEENPFFVLGLQPNAAREDVERTAQKLLAMLEIGSSSVKVYHTPLGPRERTQDLVREAVAKLRDGSVRLEAEIWAQAFSYSAPAATSAPDAADAAPERMGDVAWPEAFRAAGFTR
jgi:hypothetical protein